MNDQAIVERFETLKRKAREAFIIFEHKEGSRLVQERELPTVIRGIGVNPSEQQMAEICDLVRILATSKDLEQIKEGLEEDSQLITHERFQEIVVPWIMQNEAHLVREGFHRLMRAFKALDPDCKGYIDAQVLKTTLMTQGEMMGAEDIIKMLAHSAGGDGRIWYEDYATTLAANGRDI